MDNIVTYPLALLPQTHYKKISDIKSIEKGYLLHFTESKENLIVSGKVNPEYIERSNRSQLRDYSNNLLGVFEVDHGYIEINSKSENGYFINLWDGLSNIEKTPALAEDFSINSERGFFFLKVKNCNDVDIPYNYEADEESSVKCNVIHTPTNSNFWHISLRWIYNEEDIEYWGQKKMKGTQRKIISSARAFIIQSSIVVEPSYSEWDESIYS